MSLALLLAAELAVASAGEPVDPEPEGGIVELLREDEPRRGARRFSLSLMAGSTMAQLWSVTLFGGTAELGLGLATPRLRWGVGPRAMLGRTRWGVETWQLGVAAFVVWHRGRAWLGPSGTAGAWCLNGVTPNGGDCEYNSITVTARLLGGLDVVRFEDDSAVFVALSPAVELIAAPSWSATLALGVRH